MKIVVEGDKEKLPCEICGGLGQYPNKIFFPDYADESCLTMVHGACVRAEVKSHNIRMVEGKEIESLQLYCRHFGNRTMPEKVGDDPNA